MDIKGPEKVIMLSQLGRPRTMLLLFHFHPFSYSLHRALSVAAMGAHGEGVRYLFHCYGMKPQFGSGWREGKWAAETGSAGLVSVQP